MAENKFMEAFDREKSGHKSEAVGRLRSHARAVLDISAQHLRILPKMHQLVKNTLNKNTKMRPDLQRCVLGGMLDPAPIIFTRTFIPTRRLVPAVKTPGSTEANAVAVAKKIDMKADHGDLYSPSWRFAHTPSKLRRGTLTFRAPTAPTVQRFSLCADEMMYHRAGSTEAVAVAKKIDKADHGDV